MFARLGYPLLICALTVLAYLNSFDGVFLLDDFHHIVNNPRVRSLDPPWTPLLETTRPLVQGSMAVNYAVSELRVWSYHAVNLGLHLAAALVMFGLVRRTLLLRKEFREMASGLAATISGLWAAHPLQTESVTYIIQRGEVGMGLCVLLTLYALTRSVGSSKQRKWEMAAVSVCLVGYGFKPIMVVTPLLAWVYDRCFLSGGFATAWKVRGRLHLGLWLTPLVLPVLLAGSAVEWRTSAGFEFEGVSTLEYASTQPEIILHYLRLVIWPSPLVLDYGWPVERSWMVIGITSAVVLGLVGATIWALIRKPIWGFAGAWFFINLAPTSSFVPIADLAFEHRMYLALLAPLAVMVLCVRSLLDGKPLLEKLVPILAPVALVACAGLTYLRNGDYRSESRLWAKNVAARPEHPRPRNNLGRQLALHRQFDAAVAELKKAIALRPDYGIAWHNLGHAQRDRGDLRASREAYQKAAEFVPENPVVWQDLGTISARLGDHRSALEALGKARELQPDSPAVLLSLASAQAMAGKLEAAAETADEAEKLAQSRGLAAIAAAARERAGRYRASATPQ